MSKHYEHTIKEQSGANGKKLYHEEYFLNRQIPLPEELFHYHSYMESIYYPGYEAVNTGSQLCIFYLTQQGRLKSVIGGETTITGPGDCTIAREISGARYRTLGDEALCRTGILFSKNSFLMMMLSSLFPESHSVIHLKNPEKISALLASLKKTILDDADDLDCAVHGLIFQILYEAHRQGKRATYPDELSMALQFINSRGTKKITCDDIAANCGVSARTLTRLFQDHFNCAPWQYIMRNRLEQAKNMISFHKISIKAIADLCGFYSAAHLTRMFKQQYGLSPLNYRKASS